MQKIEQSIKPLVTIGIPCYNVAKTLELSLKSVLAQSYTNFELIITDDGSTDDTIEIVKKFNDERIILISDQQNKGISYRLNQQIDLAHGDYFLRMDGDDIMFPNRVKDQIDFLVNHPEIDVLSSQAVVIDENNNIIGFRKCDQIPQKPDDAMIGSPILHPTVAGKIEFFRKYHYDEDLCGVEDRDLWSRALVDSVFYELQRPLLFYRDTQILRRKTYLSRLKQGRKQLWRRKNIYNNKVKVYFSILIAFVKSMLALCNLNGFIIVKRNAKPIPAGYEDILKNIINS